MNYIIIYTPSYIKRAEKFSRKHPELLKQYEKVLKLLEVNPFHPTLRLHKLSGKLSELYSVSINITFRITLEFLITDKEIIPINIGSHDQVYM
jgi:mRNA-degrading endonuclease YafQ of YafQ-DinJ toxin-antitoxin module